MSDLPSYRIEDADRVWAWLGTHRGTALEIGEALSISAARVKLAIQYIRRTAQYTDGVPIVFGANDLYYRTADLDVAYMRGLANQARHLATRCQTALVEARRAGTLQARQPEVMRALFESGVKHLQTVRDSLGYYGDDLDAIERLIT